VADMSDVVITRVKCLTECSSHVSHSLISVSPTFSCHDSSIHCIIVMMSMMMMMIMVVVSWCKAFKHFAF